MQLSTFAALVALLCGLSAANELARGWGDQVNWQPVQSGLSQAKADGKTAMVIIWKSWCGACKNLKPQLAGSTEFADLSKNFVMINAGDDDEPSDSQFSPDGGYIPRILFVDAHGKVDNSIYNKRGSEKYKYYYSSPDELLESMREANQRLNGGAGSAEL